MHPVATRLLLIDDDVRLAELLQGYLGPNGFDLEHASGGPRGLALLESSVFEVVLLDVMMPGMDGLEVLRRIRSKSRIPVVMLTARGDEADRIVGLEVGADDYVAKPFSPRELLARLRALLRRSDPAAFAEKLQIGDVVVDLGSRQCSRAAVVVDLTALELDASGSASFSPSSTAAIAARARWGSACIWCSASPKPTAAASSSKTAPARVRVQQAAASCSRCRRPEVSENSARAQRRFATSMNSSTKFPEPSASHHSLITSPLTAGALTAPGVAVVVASSVQLASAPAFWALRA